MNFQKPPVWAKVKKEKKIAKSDTAPNKQDELSLEEQQTLQKSRYVSNPKFTPKNMLSQPSKCMFFLSISLVLAVILVASAKLLSPKFKN